MTDLEERLRTALHDYAENVPPSRIELDDVAATASRHVRHARYTAASVVVAVVACAGVVWAVREQGSRAVIGELPPDTTSTETIAPPDEGTLISLGPGASMKLPPSPLSGRSDPAVVWNGTEMLVWGGVTPRQGGGDTALADGAAYNPATANWRTLPAAPIQGRANPAAVWTGTELVIWGGGDDGRSLNDGAAYNPTTNTWRTIASYEAMTETIRPTIVWTGTEMIIVEGLNGMTGAAAYNPATDAWRPIAEPPGRSLAPYPQAVWTGDQVVAQLGALPYDQPILATYDVDTDTWRTVDDSDIPEPAVPRIVWTGDELLLLSPHYARAWTAETGQWRDLTTRVGQWIDSPPVWTGTAVTFWAGGNTANIYRVDTDRWETMRTVELEPRQTPGTVWADGLLLSWSGWANTPDGGARGVDNGIALNPATSPPGDAECAEGAVTIVHTLMEQRVDGDRRAPCLAVEGLAQDHPAMPPCWTVCSDGRRVVAFELGDTTAQWEKPGALTGWIVYVAVDYETRDRRVQRTIEQWELTAGDAGLRVTAVDALDTTRAEASALQAVDAYLDALAQRRYQLAAELLGRGGQNWDERQDLAPLPGAPDFADGGLLVALRRWCHTTPTCEATHTLNVEPVIGGGGDARVTATFGTPDGEVIGEFVGYVDEGAPAVFGIPPTIGPSD